MKDSITCPVCGYDEATGLKPCVSYMTPLHLDNRAKLLMSKSSIENLIELKKFVESLIEKEYSREWNDQQSVFIVA